MRIARSLIAACLTAGLIAPAGTASAAEPVQPNAGNVSERSIASHEDTVPLRHNIVITLWRDQQGQYVQETKLFDGLAYRPCTNACPYLAPLLNHRGKPTRFRLRNHDDARVTFSHQVFTSWRGREAHIINDRFFSAPTLKYVSGSDGYRFLGRLNLLQVELHDPDLPFVGTPDYFGLVQ